MCKVYSVTSQKGGTAKTTTVFNFGAYLAENRYLLMRSRKIKLLDKDTTREEREQIVAESIGNVNGSCDGLFRGF